MATGIGVDPTKDGSGNITSGRSALDDRKIFGSIYSPGILSGGVVTTSASALQYTVTEGVAAIQTATGQIVLAPIPATTLPTSANTGTAARTDIVYVKQRFPADGDSNVVVGVASTLPTNSLELMRFSVPVNAANTNAATRTGFQSFSIPYGADLGTLFQYTYTTSGNLPTGPTILGNGTFFVPTDRRIRFAITAVLFSSGAVGFDDSKYCEHLFIPRMDNTDLALWVSSGLNQARATYSWYYDMNVSAGQHSTNFTSQRAIGPGQPATQYDGASGATHRGITYSVTDVGVTI